MRKFAKLLRKLTNFFNFLNFLIYYCIINAVNCLKIASRPLNLTTEYTELFFKNSQFSFFLFFQLVMRFWLINNCSIVIEFYHILHWIFLKNLNFLFVFFLFFDLITRQHRELLEICFKVMWFDKKLHWTFKKNTQICFSFFKFVDLSTLSGPGFLEQAQPGGTNDPFYIKFDLLELGL